MRSFFKIFFASLLALVIFSLLLFFFTIGFIGGRLSKHVPRVKANSVLVLDLGQHYAEQLQNNPFSILSGNQTNIPGLYDVIRLIKKAGTDRDIRGIYILANNNPNGFAANEEIRQALQEFKSSGKFVIAHGDVMSQGAYSVANAADSVYISPQGYLQWDGYSVEYVFFKGTLDKLQIEPQIFYAGKFKSATEPLRAEKMTPENRLQTTVWLNDIYNRLLIHTAEARGVDTATLHLLANEGTIRTATNALEHKLVDALKYDDQVKDELKDRIGIGKYDQINFLSLNTYLEANAAHFGSGEKIALIYAEGDIVDGKGETGQIGGDTYRNLIRKARLDQTIKAIVFRVNSGGGSSLASETIWRELFLAKAEKPVIVSFGDVAASGGYYISCAADSIFCSPTTITGSIGVFGVIPNLETFFRNKLGVTFDGVKTGPYADAGAFYRPLSESEKRMVQASVELTYSKFKERVAEGRNRDTAYVDSIGQGRVWTGLRAREIGLVDRFGGLDDAVHAAAARAGLETYQVREYPEPENLFEKLFSKTEPVVQSRMIEEQVGKENYQLFLELKKIREMTGVTQARLPFRFFLR